MADHVAFEVYAGRDRNHVVTCNSGGVALDVTGATIVLNVKKTRDAVSNVLTLTNPVNIALTTPLLGIITLQFTDILTDGLAGMYWVELVVTTVALAELKLAEGTLNILP